MLKEVIDLQNNAVSKLVELIKADRKNEFTFKAPTGSGKTYMMADFMNRILDERSDVIFFVSTLSKGNLAKQNYDKFLEYSNKGFFNNINPYLINTEVFSEENLYIPTDFNVYILPKDLYKKDGLLMRGSMNNFLNTITSDLYGKGKKIYFIKDEGHIATNNLDKIAKNYFSKIIEFSATPNTKKAPDVEITEDNAVQAKLIKKIEIIEDDYDVEDALNKLEEIKEDYNNLLGINPCLIIQISNQNKAVDELSQKVFSALNKHQNLKWMLLVGKSKGNGVINCDTNDKIKKLPISKWKEYAKENTSTIDVIIFKMVISEGWDIPRACMLCQIRDSQSDTLDKQVIGRVRRNPRLLDFDNLSKKAQKLATTAWVWGTRSQEKNSSYAVKLFEDYTNITNEIKVKTTRLKALTEKVDFDINEFIEHKENNSYHFSNIFEMYRKLNKCDENIKKICYEYADTIDKWWNFNTNIDAVVKEYNKYTCDYSKSMEIVKDEQGKEKLISFPTSSFYVDNENHIRISDWVWKRKDGKINFSFDSVAEWEWASILNKLSNEKIKKVICGKNNPQAQNVLDGISNNLTTKFLWGKNFIANSEIKYEYYLDGIHSSYPDFVMMDIYDRIHIFEVKSVNKSNNSSFNFDSKEYQIKMKELEKCYQEASKLTGHIFYMPILEDDEWNILQFIQGKKEILTETMFIDFFKDFYLQ